MSNWAFAADPAAEHVATPARSALNAVASSVAEVFPWRPIVGQSSRLWTEEGSDRNAEGTLLAANDRLARIRKADGKLATIGLDRLSDADRQYVAAALRLLPTLAQREKPGVEQGASAQATVTPSESGSADSKLQGRLRQWLQAAKPSAPLALRLWQSPDSSPTGESKADDSKSAADTSLPSNMVYVRFSRPFLNSFVTRQVDRRHEVSDTILGHHVTGDAHVQGQVELVLLPSSDGGVAELRFGGTSTFDTVAHAGRVRVLTHGVTDFATRKPLFLDEHGLRIASAQTTAATRSSVAGIETDLPRLRGRMATRIASTRAAESRAESQAITTQKTTARVNRQFDETVARQFQDGRHELLTRIARLRNIGDLTGFGVECSTTSDTLELIVLGPVTKQQTLVAAPEAQPDSPDIEVHLHASLVNRLLNDSELRLRLQPALELLTLSQTRAITSLVGLPNLAGDGRYAVHWSDDRNWFTLVWNTEAEVGK